MAFQVSWFLDRRIIALQLSGAFTNEEISPAEQTIEEHVQAGIAPVHMLVDISTLEQFPTSLNQLRKSTPYLRHPNFGWLIVIGSNHALVGFLVSTLTQLAHVNLRMVSDWNEALATLKKVDMTLPDLQARTK